MVEGKRYLFATLGLCAFVVAGFWGSQLLNRAGHIGPRLSILSTTDLGTLQPMEVISPSIQFENTGDEVLQIIDVVSRCGCTQVGVDKQVLAPGDQATLNFKYTVGSGVGRPVLIDVVLHTNDKDNPNTYIQLSGRTPFGVRSLPTNVSLGEITVGEPKRGMFLVVTPGYNGPLHITGITTDVEGLTMQELTEVQPQDFREILKGIDGTYRVVEYTFDTPKVEGDISGRIFLKLRSDVAKSLELHFSAMVMSSVRIIPNAVLLRPITNVYVESSEKISMITLDDSEKNFSIDWKPNPDHRSGDLVLYSDHSSDQQMASKRLAVNVETRSGVKQVWLSWMSLNTDAPLRILGN